MPEKKPPLFIGQNELRLNADAICAILTYYIREKMSYSAEAPIVTGINQAEDEFVLILDAREASDG